MSYITTHIYLCLHINVLFPYPYPTSPLQVLERIHNVLAFSLVQSERTEVVDRQGILAAQRVRVGLMTVGVEVLLHLIVVRLIKSSLFLTTSTKFLLLILFIHMSSSANRVFTPQRYRMLSYSCYHCNNYIITIVCHSVLSHQS